jgi:hypothetical protein
MIVSSFLMMEEDPDGCPRKGCRVEFFFNLSTLFACMGLVAKAERRNGEGRCNGTCSITIHYCLLKFIIEF